eukprot:5018-Heterococcus_DN1.PRE.1
MSVVRCCCTRVRTRNRASIAFFLWVLNGTQQQNTSNAVVFVICSNTTADVAAHGKLAHHHAMRYAGVHFDQLHLQASVRSTNII